MELRRSVITGETCTCAALMADRSSLGPIHGPAARAAGVPPGASAGLPSPAHQRPNRLRQDAAAPALRLSYQAIADTICSATTIRNRRDEWIALGVFARLKQIALESCDRIVGLVLRAPGHRHRRLLRSRRHDHRRAELDPAGVDNPPLGRTPESPVMTPRPSARPVRQKVAGNRNRTSVSCSDSSHRRRAVWGSAAAVDNRTCVGPPRNSAKPSGPMNSPPFTSWAVAAYS